MGMNTSMNLPAAIALTLLFTAAAYTEEPSRASADDFALREIVIGQPARIEVLPRAIDLTGARERVRVIVTAHYDDQDGRPVPSQDVTRVAMLAIEDDAIARLEGSEVFPNTDGNTSLRVRVGDNSASVPVVVTNATVHQPVSFLYDTLAALSKQGCSAGVCHGSPMGKGGFRLSLRAFDPELDKLTLIREFTGRRTNSVEPERSLILLKPLGEVAHGGNVRLRRSDPAYAILHDWVSEGHRVDPTDAPVCTSIRVDPPSGQLINAPAHTQQLRVEAHFSDGSRRDVSHLAVYSAPDPVIASVTDDGLVIGHGRGETAVLTRYLEHIVATTMTFAEDVEGFVWSDPPTNNYIDELVHEKLRALQFLPSELCTDGEFVRRVHLDLLGVLPTLSEIESFLSDKSSDKRDRLIDRLLERPEYADFWALKWGDLLRLTRVNLGEEGAHKYHYWLREAFRRNVPYDKFTRELLTANGSTLTNPPANYFRAAGDPADLMETTTQVFLGARLQCAKCHNHPFESWTQDNYYGMTAFFSRVQRKELGGPEEIVVWTERSGETLHPRTGEPTKPWVPVAGEITTDAERRRALVEWLTQKDNPFLARVEANRIWSHLFGRGIVEPFDDFRDTNPPANSPLLDALSEEFVEQGYDRKHLIRTILRSRTYQASAETNAFNEGENRYFSHYATRMLTAEQLMNAICRVVDMNANLPGLPQDTLAIGLPAPDLLGESESDAFLKIFGQSKRQTVCACERADDARLGQALQLFNGEFVHTRLQSRKNRFRRAMSDGYSNEEILRELYLVAYCRLPTDEELTTSRNYLEERGNRRKGLEDIAWALLNANEFLFQH